MSVQKRKKKEQNGYRFLCRNKSIYIHMYMYIYMHVRIYAILLIQHTHRQSAPKKGNRVPNWHIVSPFVFAIIFSIINNNNGYKTYNNKQ